MATLTVSENELRDLAHLRDDGYEYNPKGYILLVWGRSGQHHIRIDLEKWHTNRYQKMGADYNSSYEFLLSSFHVKREAYYSEQEQDYDYLYFDYQGGGVWQPAWGYKKTEKLSGKWSPQQVSGDEAWGIGMEIARLFLDDLGRVLKMDQHMANGPMLGPNR